MLNQIKALIEVATNDSPLQTEELRKQFVALIGKKIPKSGMRVEKVGELQLITLIGFKVKHPFPPPQSNTPGSS